MIRVNLLPEEYRPTEGASWSVLLTVIVVVLAVAGTAIFALFTQFRSGGLDSELQAAEVEAKNLKAKADLCDDLMRQITAASTREATIKRIAQSKINWAKKLDELTDLLLENQMWIDELELVEGEEKAPVAGQVMDAGRLRIKAYFCGNAAGLVNTFYRQLKNHKSFFSIFRDASQPETSRVSISSAYGQEFVPDQDENLLSTINLYLKGTEVAPAVPPAGP